MLAQLQRPSGILMGFVRLLEKQYRWDFHGDVKVEDFIASMTQWGWEDLAETNTAEPRLHIRTVESVPGNLCSHNEHTWACRIPTVCEHFEKCSHTVWVRSVI